MVDKLSILIKFVKYDKRKWKSLKAIFIKKSTFDESLSPSLLKNM